MKRFDAWLRTVLRDDDKFVILTDGYVRFNVSFFRYFLYNHLLFHLGVLPWTFFTTEKRLHTCATSLLQCPVPLENYPPPPLSLQVPGSIWVLINMMMPLNKIGRIAFYYIPIASSLALTSQFCLGR